MCVESGGTAGGVAFDGVDGGHVRRSWGQRRVDLGFPWFAFLTLIRAGRRFDLVEQVVDRLVACRRDADSLGVARRRRSAARSSSLPRAGRPWITRWRRSSESTRLHLLEVGGLDGRGNGPRCRIDLKRGVAAVFASRECRAARARPPGRGCCRGAGDKGLCSGTSGSDGPRVGRVVACQGRP